MNEKYHVLITGINGFVGRSLCESLLMNNIRVSGTSRSIVGDKRPLRKIYKVNLTNKDKVESLFTRLQPDVVIHLAGSKNRSLEISKFNDIYTNNILMSMNVIDACLLLPNLKRMIFIGSCDEYGDVALPYIETQKELATSAYGLSKLAITQVLSGLFMSNKFPSVVLRPSVIYGPGQGSEMFLSALSRSLLLKKYFSMTKGDQKRDFIYISDVVNAIVSAISADDSVNGEIINIAAGVSYKIKEVTMLVSNIVNDQVYKYIRFGACSYRNNEVMDYSVSIKHAEKTLQWSPKINLKTGLEKTINHLKNI